jgi:lysophospholipase L1-like esterase
MKLKRSGHVIVRALLMLAVLAVCAAAAQAAPLLKSGDRMVFLGDSITEQRIHTRYVMDFFTLRYPNLDISFRNAGWSGHKATDGLKRLDRDVLSLKPAVVSICFGMNDGNYKAFEQAGYDTYMAAMTQLVDELTKAKVKTVLLTPGCIDPSKSNKPGMEVYNDTLTRYAQGVLELAKKNELPSFDLDSLMLDIQKRGKADDPAFTIVSATDAIHPSNPGQSVMAYALLKALGATDQASGLAIDAAAGKATPDRCKVTDLKATPDLITFTRTDEALPTYLDRDARNIAKYFPFDEEMNRYPLTVMGLKKVDYVLTVEGTIVGTFPGDELAKGVNLAALPGPWATLAETVNTLSKEQEDIYYTRWRSIGLLGVPNEAQAEKDALVAKCDELVTKKEAERRKAVAGDRAWKWELKALPAPVGDATAAKP